MIITHLARVRRPRARAAAGQPQPPAGSTRVAWGWFALPLCVVSNHTSRVHMHMRTDHERQISIPTIKSRVLFALRFVVVLLLI